MYDLAMEQYQMFMETPAMWQEDPEMRTPDGKLNLCLDCINVDWSKPEDIMDAHRLIEEGYSMGTHYNEEAFHNGLKAMGVPLPVYNSKPAVKAAAMPQKANGGIHYGAYAPPMFAGGGMPCYECGGMYAEGGDTGCPPGTVPDGNGNCVSDLSTPPTPNSSLYQYYQDALSKPGMTEEIARKMIKSRRTCKPGDECWEEELVQQVQQPTKRDGYYLEPSGNPGVGVLHFSGNDGNGQYTHKVVGPTLARDWYNDRDQQVFFDIDPNTTSPSITYNPDIKIYESMEAASSVINNERMDPIKAKAEQRRREAAAKIEQQKQMMLQQKGNGGDYIPFEQYEQYAEGGGIPERYKNMGFTKVGVKKESTSAGKKWMVLAKKGDQYKVVHGGYDGMKDYTQHGSEDRRERFWDRMGGRDSAKAKDPFSPLYWHKRFGTWAEGGELPEMQDAGPVPSFDGDKPQFLRQTGPTIENLRKFMGTDRLTQYDGSANPEPGNLSQDQQANSPIGSIIEFLDPSGIMSHDDASKAYKDWKASGNSMPTFDQALSIFSAIPALGKYGKFSYIAGTGADGMKALYKSFPWQQALNLWEMQSESQGDDIPSKANGGAAGMYKYDDGGDYSKMFREGDHTIDTTYSKQLNNLENNKWNRGLAVANSLSDPRNFTSMLPDKGFGSGLKAITGLASGLAGATLGYEKMFAKDKTESNMFNPQTKEMGKTQDVLKARYDKANPAQPAQQPQASAPAAGPSMMPYGLSPELMQQISNQAASMPGASAKTPTLNTDRARGESKAMMDKSMAESEAYDAERKKAMDANNRWGAAEDSVVPYNYDPSTGYHTDVESNLTARWDTPMRILYKDGKPEETESGIGVYKTAFREKPEDLAALQKEGYYKKKDSEGTTYDWDNSALDDKTGKWIDFKDNPAFATEQGYDVPGYSTPATATGMPASTGMNRQDKMDQNWIDNGYVKDASGQWVEKDKPQQQATTPTQPTIPTGSTPNQMVNRGQGTLKQDAQGNYLYGSDATGWSKSQNRELAESKWRAGSYNQTPQVNTQIPAIPAGLESLMNGIQRKREGGLTKFWPGGPFDPQAFQNMINGQMGKTGTGVHTDEQGAGQQMGSYADFNRQGKDAPLQYQKDWETTERGDTAGFVAANNALIGLGAVNSVLGAKNQQKQYNQEMVKIGNTDSMYNAVNASNPYGNYTTNVGIGPNFALVRQTAAQDFSDANLARNGGTMKRKYKQGGSYMVSNEELMEILRNGGDVEFL
jgi:hypothetical protein